MQPALASSLLTDVSRLDFRHSGNGGAPQQEELTNMARYPTLDRTTHQERGASHVRDHDTGGVRPPAGGLRGMLPSAELSDLSVVGVGLGAVSGPPDAHGGRPGV